ncbi:MAG: hypothetical protein M3N51_00770 [Actinomycetota bacterium]|nr:hypothetical protein [Actinomycetota bacterium]
MRRAPAFYARPGSSLGDLITVLHPPYTAWHLAYVVMGASLAPRLDWPRLAGTLVAFLAGTGVAAHALDEWNGRPLGTRLSDTALLALAAAGFVAAGLVTVLGVRVISPWLLGWAAIGFLAASAYPLEWWGGALHTDLGFALSWGALPSLVGFWAQAERLSLPAVGMAAVATLLSLAQRSLSTPARHVRRRTERAVVLFDTPRGRDSWEEAELLATWEAPLRWLTWAALTLAATLLALAGR